MDLVLSGGGVKGIGLVGAVVALMEAGYHAQRVSGTSFFAAAPKHLGNRVARNWTPRCRQKGEKRELPSPLVEAVRCRARRA